MAPATIETLLKVALTTLPLAVIGLAPVLPTTGVVMIPVPDAVSTKFPLVAVIAPDVAVRVVDAVKDPVTAVFPVAFPIATAPVPPVPIVVTAEPEVFMVVVPVIAAPPADAVTPPVVAISPVEAVRDPVTAVFPVALPIFTAPVPPVPMVVTAEPDALINVVPTIVVAPVMVVAPVFVANHARVKVPAIAELLVKVISPKERVPAPAPAIDGLLEEFITQF